MYPELRKFTPSRPSQPSSALRSILPVTRIYQKKFQVGFLPFTFSLPLEVSFRGMHTISQLIIFIYPFFSGVSRYEPSASSSYYDHAYHIVQEYLYSTIPTNPAFSPLSPLYRKRHKMGLTIAFQPHPQPPPSSPLLRLDIQILLLFYFIFSFMYYHHKFPSIFPSIRRPFIHRKKGGRVLMETCSLLFFFFFFLLSHLRRPQTVSGVSYFTMLITRGRVVMNSLFFIVCIAQRLDLGGEEVREFHLIVLVQAPIRLSCGGGEGDEM